MEERLLEWLCQLSSLAETSVTIRQAFRKVSLCGDRALGLEIADPWGLGDWMTFFGQQRARPRTLQGGCGEGSSSARPLLLIPVRTPL